jgi:hypothetical protein
MGRTAACRWASDRLTKTIGHARSGSWRRVLDGEFDSPPSPPPICGLTAGVGLSRASHRRLQRREPSIPLGLRLPRAARGLSNPSGVGIITCPLSRSTPWAASDLVTRTRRTPVGKVALATLASSPSVAHGEVLMPTARSPGRSAGPPLRRHRHNSRSERSGSGRRRGAGHSWVGCNRDRRPNRSHRRGGSTGETCLRMLTDQRRS